MSGMRVVAHVDVDCFFVQAELLHRKELIGKPVIVIQHDDVLSVSPEAQELGIRRHDITEQVRETFPQVTVLSVPMETGTTKVSYEKYLRLSDQIFSVISKKFKGPIEKSGMDEAYIELSDLNVDEFGDTFPCDQVIYGTTNTSIFTPSERRIIQCGFYCQQLREEIKEKVGIIVSIGIGANKFISKVASARFKPNCQMVILPRFHQELLKQYPITRIPKYKSNCAEYREILESQMKLQTISDVLRRKEEIIQIRADCIDWLLEIVQGIDNSPVVQSQPPKSVSVSMTLTPIADKNLLQIRKILEYLITNFQNRLRFDEEAHSRKPVCFCVRFRFVNEKEMKGENFQVPGNSQCGEAWEKLLEKILQQIITLGKAHQPWNLRWCGLFCTKFTEITKNSLSKYFAPQSSKPSPKSQCYPSMKKRPLVTPIVKKQSSTKVKIFPVQPSMLNYFTPK